MDYKKIISQLSLEEKISFLSGKDWWQTVDFPQWNIPSIFLADGPCGLRKQEGQGDHLGINDSIPATATVSGACLAATWNPDCFFLNGQILGEEAAEAEVDVLLAPAMNIVRSPLCGRNFEYFSEDPYLTGQVAIGYVNGVQESGTGACLKHYAANNQETEREYIDAIIDERTLREIYLPAFEMAVKEAKPQAVMSALNQINGTYGAEHKHLLTEILREEWGFTGFTVSDWFGIVHPAEAVASGMDLNMPCSNVGREKIKQAIDEGTLTEEEVDICCLHLLESIESCLARRKKRGQQTRSELHRKHHEQIRHIAEEGIVLLKNDNHILPLMPSDKVAVIGVYAKEARITLEGSARVIKTAQDNPLEFIQSIGGANVSYAQGYLDREIRGNGLPYLQAGISEEDDAVMEHKAVALADEAVALAKKCDKVLFFMGQPAGTEMEGHDRKTILLPAEQEALLFRILAVNPNVIVILSNASAVAMPWESDVQAIFECFLAGQGFGCALANLLYGKSNPSGKLPVSFTKYLEDTSAYMDFPGNKKQVTYSEGVFVGYRYYDLKRTDLLYPFGHGLSYTTFAYSNLKMEREIFDRDEKDISLTMMITNTGSRAGAEVVQLYVGAFDTVVKRPKKELKGFQKVFLEPGESRELSFTLTKRDFSFYYEQYQEWYAPKGEYQILIGASAADLRLSAPLLVVPQKEHLKPLSGWAKVGELRRTSEGEAIYQELLQKLNVLLTEDSLFMSRSDLKNDEKMNQHSLRHINLFTDGMIDNDELLQLVDEANKSR